MKKIADLRKDYQFDILERKDLAKDPFKQFEKWFSIAEQSKVEEPNAMTLATANAKGKPSARIVLLKGVEDGGFLFFTNYGSNKAKDLDKNPYATLVFHWNLLERQIIIDGRIKKLSRKRSEVYFRSRPRPSQIGAWASAQSSVIQNRSVLHQAHERLEKEFEGKEIPIPPFWGGYVCVPRVFQFWQGGGGRLHDRFRYRKSRGGWKIERLSP